jgi:uncharacterized protein
MLRTSSYTIYVDLPGNSEEMLLVHGYTGTYDKVSRRVATYVRSLEARRPPKPLYGDWTPEPTDDGAALTPSCATIEVLTRRGYLTELSCQDEEDHFAERVTRLHERQLRRMPNYIVMPTYDCNLRCSYCFQDHMRTDSRFSHLLRVMSPATIDRIVEAMLQIEAMHGVEEDARHRTVGFFGGEPLLAASRPTVEYLFNRIRDAGTASFWAVTNGTELEAYRDLLSPQKISFLQITLDGPPDEHDRRRIYPDQSGSYERIAGNISMVLDLGVKVSIRVNLDRNNITFLEPLVTDFEQRGWAGNPLFSVYAAPIRAENDKTDAKSTFNTWELDQALAALTHQSPQLEMVSRPDDGIKVNAGQLFAARGPAIPSLRESFCSAHDRMYIFDAFSDIYACWERTGDPKVRIGHLEDDGRVNINMTVNDLWRTRTVASNPVCRKCRYALSCGGGCAVLAFGRTGTYHSNFCDGFASRFRSSVAESYLDHLSGNGPKRNIDRVCDQ